MFDNTVSVEERREQIQAETEEMDSQKNGCGVNELPAGPETVPGNFGKDYEENIKKDEDYDPANFLKDDNWYEEFLESDEGKSFRQKRIEMRRRTKLYDFGTGEMSTDGEMSDFYGEELVDRVHVEIYESNQRDSDRKSGFVSPELFKEMKAMRGSKIIPKAKKLKTKKIDTSLKICSVPNKIIQRERKPGDNYFKKIERGIIRNETYRKIFKGPGIIYEWIWANLVRSQWIDTKGYPIKEQYYDKGFLAYCSSYRKIGKECFLHKNKVKEYIDAFQEAGIIKVEHLTPVGKTRGQSVFILGELKEVNGKRKEFYYINEIFLTQKDGQNMPD